MSSSMSSPPPFKKASSTESFFLLKVPSSSPPKDRRHSESLSDSLSELRTAIYRAEYGPFSGTYSSFEKKSPVRRVNEIALTITTDNEGQNYLTGLSHQEGVMSERHTNFYNACQSMLKKKEAVPVKLTACSEENVFEITVKIGFASFEFPILRNSQAVAEHS